MSLTQLPHEAGFLTLHLFEVELLDVHCLAIKQNVESSLMWFDLSELLFQVTLWSSLQR